MIDIAMDDGASAMDARLLGQTLGGSYRVLRRIGAGGMGQVYEAEHTLLGRHFALKVLDTSQKTRRDAVSRFFAEARAASQIEHPHIVDVVNFVTDGPYMVLVMELLRGESLAERLTRGPLPILEASAILGQVCEAVAATHAAGILHRDLKPGNVFLTQVRGATHAKVLDYGIAKLKHAGAESGGEGQAAGVTTTGQLLGTPRYLSPEQARGSLHIDERADVYAAGVMLFEMLAGRPPFEGHNAFQLIWKHGNEPAPPLSAHAPGIPAELSDVVARALAKEPEERFHSMLALRDAVRDATSALVERPEPAAAKEPKAPVAGRAPWAVLAALLGVVLVGATVLLAMDRTDVQAGEPVASATPPERPAPASTEPSLTSALRTDLDAPPSTAREVTLVLTVQPPEARVAVDGAEPGPVPATLQVPAGRPLTLQFSAPGHVPEVRTLTPTEAGEVAVALSRRRGRMPRGENPSPIKRDF
ncbi:MAG: protein kinase [Sandaracinaceae bacterium]|nr:protein kinase [Sandaracinaceae bacterium]